MDDDIYFRRRERDDSSSSESEGPAPPKPKKPRQNLDGVGALASMLGDGYGKPVTSTPTLIQAGQDAKSAAEQLSAAQDAAKEKYSKEDMEYPFAGASRIFLGPEKVSMSKRKKKDGRSFLAGVPPATLPTSELKEKRETFSQSLGGDAYDFINDMDKRVKVLELFKELLAANDLSILPEIAQACATAGCSAHDAWRDILALVENCRHPDNRITAECYRAVVDHLCLSADPQFAEQALESVLEYKFGPKEMEFVSNDAADYFLRLQHFVSMEVGEETATVLQQKEIGNRAVSVDMWPNLEGHIRGAHIWDVKPTKPWQVPRDRFRDGGLRDINQPVRGDVMFVVSGMDVCVAIVQDCRGVDSALPVATIKMEQGERMHRIIKGRQAIFAVVGASATAYERMRIAIWEMSKRLCRSPLMQQWMVMRTPTAGPHSNNPESGKRKRRDDIPKDGGTRLWVKFTDIKEPASIEASGAEWTELLQPGSRDGMLAFFQDNVYGMQDFMPELVTGRIIVVSRGECSFADKARNAARAGALAMIVVDSGETVDLFPPQRDEKPIIVDFPLGLPIGFSVALNEASRVAVVDIAPSSPLAVTPVLPGFLVEEVSGEDDMTPEEAEEVLTTDKPLERPLKIVFRCDKVAPAIPTVLIRRESGERLMREMKAAHEKGIPMPMAEMHVAEYIAEHGGVKQGGLSEAQQAKMNRPQIEAVQAGLLEGGKSGGNVNLIQGPPGTGKTTCALHIISHWANQECGDLGLQESLYSGNKILVTGFSNIAIDNIALGLQRMGVSPIIRVGRGATFLTADTLEDKIREHPDFMELNAAREACKNVGGRARGDVRRLEDRIVQECLMNARVVLATCITSGGDVLKGCRFRRVLFDEATQATETASLVPLNKGVEDLVMLGDQAQLPPTVMSNKARLLGLAESLFERLVRLGVSHKMLRIQYRMHPALSAFPSHAFYGGLLSNGVRAEEREPPEGYTWPNPTLPIAFEAVGFPGQTLEETLGTSKQNQVEAERVVQIVIELIQAADVPAAEIAVITPYAAQLVLLKSLLAARASASVPVATVDSFQGMERDVVVCSTVRCSGTSVGFLQDRRRFNVLLTRARRGLIVLGHQKTLLSDPCWGKWVEYCMQQRVVCGAAQMLTEPIADLPDAPEDPTYNAAPGHWMAFAGESWINKAVQQLEEQKAEFARKKAEEEAALKARREEMQRQLREKMEAIKQKREAAKAAMAQEKEALAITFDQVIATAEDLLLQNPNSCFNPMGRIPIDFQMPLPNMHTASITVALPDGGSQIAKAAAKSPTEAEARGLVRACQIFAECELLEAGIVSSLTQDLEKAMAGAKLQQQAAEAASEAVELPSAEYACHAELSGSVADGTAVQGSDFDFLLVLDSLSESPRTLFKKLSSGPAGFGKLQVDCSFSRMAFFGNDEIGGLEQNSMPDDRVCDLGSMFVNAFYMRKIQEIGPGLALPAGWRFVKACLKGPTVQMLFEYCGALVEVDLCLAIRVRGLPLCQVAESVSSVCIDHFVVPSHTCRADAQGEWMLSLKAAERALTKNLLPSQRLCLRALKTFCVATGCKLWSSYAVKTLVLQEAMQYPSESDWGDGNLGARVYSILHKLGAAADDKYLASALIPEMNVWQAFHHPELEKLSSGLRKQVLLMADVIVWQDDREENAAVFRELFS